MLLMAKLHLRLGKSDCNPRRVKMCVLGIIVSTCAGRQSEAEL